MREPFIHNGVQEFEEKKLLRFCMPGHKGKPTGSFLDAVAGFDTTELFSTDHLFSPEGIIKKAEETATELYKSLHTSFSACGASPLVKAAVWLSAKNGRILADRSSHLSLTHGAVLSGTDLSFLDCILSELGIPNPPTPAEVEKGLKNEPDINAVFITSPNYFGVLADTGGISAVCKTYQVTLIVDNSHGSHLAFLERGEKHPNQLGADLVIDSAHKTLPALTGAALFHCNTAVFSKEEVKEAILLFSSTSPSYLILSSLDRAICWSDENRELYHKAAENREKICQILNGMGFSCLSGEAFDPLRLTIVTGAVGIDSNDVNKWLFDQGIACEMADGNSLVLILSPLDSLEELLLVANKLNIYYNERGTIRSAIQSVILPKPQKILPVREAFLAPKETVLLQDAAGRICGECVTAFPPCIPLAISGELMTEAHVAAVRQLSDREKLSVIKETV